MLDSTLLSSFSTELQKRAGSRLRRAVQVIAKKKEYLPGWVDFGLHHGGEEIGRLTTLHGTIVDSHIDRKYQGLGLGKKLYGEAMRRLPGQELKSGGQVSEAAQRVWGSMGKNPSYSVTKLPGIKKDYGVRKVIENLPENLGKPIFTGQLPAAAAKGYK